MRLSIRVGLLCAAAVLPSLAVQAWNAAELRASRIEEVRGEALRFALQSAAELARVIDGAEQVLTAIGVSTLRDGLPAACAAELNEIQQRLDRYTALGLTNPDGTTLCTSRGEGGPAIGDRAYFAAARASGQREIGTYQISRTTGLPVLPVAVPIVVGSEIRLIAVASLDLGWLSANLAGNVAVPPGGSITVADREGTILARTPQPERFVGTRIPEGFAHLLRAEAPGVLDVTSQDGTRRVLGYVPVAMPPGGFYVSAGFATGHAYAEVDRATWRAGLLILAGLLSALLAASLFGRAYLRAPLMQLLATMSRWAEGDRAARATTTESWEVGRLAAGFNDMAEAIAAREDALRAGEARLRAVLDGMPIGVVLAEVPSGRTLFRNAHAAALLGSTGVEQVPAPLAEPLRHAVQDDGTTEGLELPLRRPDGSETVIALRAATVTVPGGPPLAVAAFVDVGSRVHAERQRALLTAELRHRVKNALAVVQAVAAQTLASSATLDEFKTNFGGRLRDLARAQDALFSAADGRVALGWLIETALAPFAREAVSVVGPEVPLPAKQTLAMALVLHEMATNAAKHGALRPGGAGRLDVRWRVEAGEVVLTWREGRPGEVVAVPETGRGFGARLITRCVAHDLRGMAAWRAEDGALVWEISFPLPEEAEAPEMEPAAV